MSTQHATETRKSTALPTTQFSTPFPVNSLLHARSISHIAAHQMRASQASQTSPTTVLRSRSIPINSDGIKRTPSELKLHQDEQVADYRDYVMFRRIVDRISQQQEQTQDLRLRRENDLCLAHVIEIRNGSDDKSHQRYMLSDFVPQQMQRESCLEDSPGHSEDGIFAMDF